MESASLLLLALFLPPQTAPPPSPGAVLVETFGPELGGGSGGVSVDAEGRVYVADFGSQLGGGGVPGTRVFRLAPDGTGGVWMEGFQGASGNTFDRHGNFYQSNIRGGYVERLTPEGERRVLVRGVRGPVGVSVDEEGLVFVAACGGNVLLEVTPEGERSVLAESPLLQCPNGLTMDDDHVLYVANFGNGDVLRISPVGEVERLTTLPGNNNGHLVYHEGFLYVVARSDHRIYRVSLDGQAEVFAGTGERGHRDGPALQATFSYPNDIDVAPDGRTLYVNEPTSTTAPHTELAPMIVRRLRLPEPRAAR